MAHRFTFEMDPDDYIDALDWLEKDAKQHDQPVVVKQLIDRLRASQPTPMPPVAESR